MSMGKMPLVEYKYLWFLLDKVLDDITVLHRNRAAFLEARACVADLLLMMEAEDTNDRTTG